MLVAHLSILIVLIFVSINATSLGSYLIVRKESMLADAISHALLPGIVLAFWTTGHRSGLMPLLFAALAGLMTTQFINLLAERLKLRKDIAIGATYALFFAVGITMIALMGDQVDLDQDCVLFGEAAYIPLETFTFIGLELPSALLPLGLVSLINFIVLFAFRPKWQLTSFDPDYATSVGVKTALWSQLLMFCLSITAVASFEIVGSVMFLALVALPAATAYLLTSDFERMWRLGMILSILGILIGYALAWFADGSITGSIALVEGLFLAVAYLQYRARNKVSVLAPQSLTR